jgi:hypothetical protein
MVGHPQGVCGWDTFVLRYALGVTLGFSLLAGWRPAALNIRDSEKSITTATKRHLFEFLWKTPQEVNPIWVPGVYGMRVAWRVLARRVCAASCNARGRQGRSVLIDHRTIHEWIMATDGW